MMWKRLAKVMSGLALIVVIGGLLVPEEMVIPVKGATPADWNSKSFWFRPWGKSGVHRGIDIFAREGTSVIAASPGIVVFAGTLVNGGNAVAVLGPKWRVHYYAHLQSIKISSGQFVPQGKEIGTVGTTGNAVGKPPHLHYSIITQIPYVWRFKMERFGFDRMFYLDPLERLKGAERGSFYRMYFNAGAASGAPTVHTTAAQQTDPAVYCPQASYQPGAVCA